MTKASIVLALLALAGCTSSPQPAPSPSIPSGAPARPGNATAATSAPDPAAVASSPEEAWSKLLLAMRNGTPVEPFATPAGIASLAQGVGDEPRRQVFARWGSGWASWEVRWRARTDESAEALLGPEAKEHGLRFVRTPEGWKLDRWTPGE